MKCRRTNVFLVAGEVAVVVLAIIGRNSKYRNVLAIGEKNHVVIDAEPDQDMIDVSQCARALNWPLVPGCC